MANHCVAWLLVASYVVLFGISGCGIGVTVFNFGKPAKVIPEPPKVNVTKIDHYYDRPNLPEEVRKYAESMRGCVDYNKNLKTFLVLPCGVNALVVAPLILGALCSRNIFSKSIGLYSSLVLWFLNLRGVILFQNDVSDMVDSSDDNPWGEYLTVLGIQIGMIVVITIQVILAAWELRRQKTGWPTIHFSHLLTLDTVMLIARIVVLEYTVDVLRGSTVMYGLINPTYQGLYKNYGYGLLPRMKYPEYYFFPTAIGILYCTVVAIESLLSHIIGYTHTKMLWFTSLLSAMLCCGITVIVSPAFIKAILNGVIPMELMHWNIGSMILCFVHAIAVLFMPKAMSAPPTFITKASTEMMKSFDVISSINLSANQSSFVTSNSERIISTATAVRSKFTGSNTLLYNTVVLVINNLSMVIMLANFPWFWGGKLMLCSNFAILNRYLPAVVLEVVTGRVESTSALKELLHFFVETVILLVGVCASFSWFYGAIGFAIFINICLVIIQFVKMVKTPGFKRAAANLSQHEVARSDGSLVSESEKGSESSLQKDVKSAIDDKPLV